jgi:hypothetical protein
LPAASDGECFAWHCWRSGRNTVSPAYATVAQSDSSCGYSSPRDCHD